MPTNPQCTNCKRLGGYYEKESDKICARCKRAKIQPRLEDTDNKLDKKEEKYN